MTVEVVGRNLNSFEVELQKQMSIFICTVTINLHYVPFGRAQNIRLCGKKNENYHGQVS